MQLLLCCWGMPSPFLSSVSLVLVTMTPHGLDYPGVTWGPCPGCDPSQPLVCPQAAHWWVSPALCQLSGRKFTLSQPKPQQTQANWHFQILAMLCLNLVTCKELLLTCKELLCLSWESQHRGEDGHTWSVCVRWRKTLIRLMIHTTTHLFVFGYEDTLMLEKAVK